MKNARSNKSLLGSGKPLNRLRSDAQGWLAAIRNRFLQAVGEKPAWKGRVFLNMDKRSIRLFVVLFLSIMAAFWIGGKLTNPSDTPGLTPQQTERMWREAAAIQAKQLEDQKVVVIVVQP